MSSFISALYSPSSASSSRLTIPPRPPRSCSEKNRERVYAPLRIFRPTVREIIAGMSQEDIMLVEEGFQRLMLQYDRVFTGASACASTTSRTS